MAGKGQSGGRGRGRKGTALAGATGRGAEQAKVAAPTTAIGNMSADEILNSLEQGTGADGNLRFKADTPQHVKDAANAIYLWTAGNVDSVRDIGNYKDFLGGSPVQGPSTPVKNADGSSFSASSKRADYVKANQIMNNLANRPVPKGQRRDLWRGVDLKQNEIEAHRFFLGANSKLKENSHTLRSFASFTDTKGAEFSRNVVLHIKNSPKGSNIAKWSGYKSEKEWIVGGNYKVLREVQRTDGRIQFDIELLP